MKYYLLLLISLFSINGFSYHYNSLDANDPIVFKGNSIVYQGQEIVLNEKNIYVDALLSDLIVDTLPFVFNDFNAAAKHFKSGTETEPMTVYIAPYVYWVDNPDDPEVRKPLPGQSAPFALIVNCQWLKLVGLSTNPENVVLAVNRGQSQGANGNFTLMEYHGDGLQLHNMTVGNYCNIDLVYPLKPALNRERRTNAITQAQLILAYGDKNQAHNVRFLSRLNLNPIFRSKRTLFNKCYFEMTDDSLCDSGVYLDCAFTFYGSKPFGSTQPFGGAAFLNCDFYLETTKFQYLVKSHGPVTLIDTRYHSTNPVYIGWTQDPTVERRFYQSNVTLNGAPFTVGANNPDNTVDISNDPLLNAYKVAIGDRVIYNTYNLLAGDDGWDPMGVRRDILDAETHLKTTLKEIPVYLGLNINTDTLRAGQFGRTITAFSKLHGGYDANIPNLTWEYDPSLFKLIGDNSQKLIYSINESDSTCASTIRVTSDLGLEAAKVLVAEPMMLDAPAFISSPKLMLEYEGKLKLDYILDLKGRDDMSTITWYRCSSLNDSNPIPVKITRFNNPIKQYQLTANDVGHCIMAEISPKHIRSNYGETVKVYWDNRVEKGDVKNTNRYYTDFTDFPETQQPQIIPGFWTVDGYKPKDTAYYADWRADSIRNWCYGKGMDAARGYSGLLQSARGARLMFTPVDNSYGDMCINLELAPCKGVAQGFGSATGQYMDICIKFDTRTLTGYGLRIIRTTKYHNAVDFYLVKYNNGETTQISKALSGICYLPLCTVTVMTKGNKISAKVVTTAEMRKTDDKELHKSINLEAIMDEPNSFGGVAIQHTGTGWSNSTLLQSLQVDWMDN